MRQVTSATLSNQNIATALLVATYTCDADRLLFVRVVVDQVAGNGSYSAYVTLQEAGAGSAYQIQPVTTATVASGVTAIAFATIALPVKNTDVVKVYVLGLAGDTTTPDIITRILEDDSLRPTNADRTLDVSIGGEAGLDWANVGSPSATVSLSTTTVATVTTTATATAVTTVNGLAAGVITAASIAADAITAAKIATNAIDADALATDAVSEIVAAMTAPDNTTISNIYSRIGAPVGASISADIAGVQADTDNIQIRLPAALVSGRIDASVGAMATDVVNAASLASDAVAEIQSGLATPTNITTVATVTNLTNAPTAGDLTAAMKTSVTTAATAATPVAASVTGNVGGNVVGSVGSVVSGVTVTTNNDKTGYALSTAGIKAVWDQLTSALTTPGSVGKAIVDFIASYVAPSTPPSAAAIRAEIDSNSTQLAKLGTPVASISADIAGVQADTDDIQTRLGVNGVGLTALASATNLATANTNISAINTKLGTPAGASVSADIAAIKTDTAAIKAKSDGLPSDPADASDIAAAVAALQADTDNIQTRLPAALVGGRIDASIGSLATGSLDVATFTDALLEKISDVVNGRGGSHLDGIGEKYSTYHLRQAILNGIMQSGAWTPYTTTDVAIPGLVVPIDTDPDAVPVYGTH